MLDLSFVVFFLIFCFFRSDLEEILWADMQVYEQFLGESMYHLETFVSSAAPISFSLSFLFLSLLLSFFF